MRLSSYNIRKAIGRDRRHDPARILAVLNEVAADVVVLQEADRRLGHRPAALPEALIREHTDYRPAPVAANDVSVGWHGNAVLVRRGIEISGVQRVTLPSLEPRGAVCVEIEGRLRITGAHLGLTRRHRRRQMQALRHHHGTGLLPMVLMGDFNEWSRVVGSEALEAAFDLHAPGASYPTLRPVGHLDRIALSPGVHLRAKGVHDSPLARRASDHLPIWAEISLPSGADD